MPGSIRVSVLESVDLPAEATGGNCVSIKVAVGKREFQTKPSKVDGGRTAAWNSDFAFPVLNLRDNLMVVLLNSKGNAVAQTDIETPSIVEKGFWDELFPLKGGGRIHLRLSFVLTEEERKRIQAMRAAAMKRKKQGVLKKNASIQVLRPGAENAAAENGESSLVSSTGIPQSIPENLQGRGASDYKENEVPVPSVPRVSEIRDARLKIEHIPEASGGFIFASTSSTFMPASKEEVSTQDSKNISGHYLPQHGHKDLPQHRCEETSRGLQYEKLNQSKEPILSEGLSSLPYQIFSAFEEARDEAVMQANTTVLNQDLQHALLPAEGSQREGHADSEYVETDDAIDKPRINGTGNMKVEEEDMAAKLQESLIVPVTSSCQTLVATQQTQKIDAPGSPLLPADESITSKMTSPGPLSHFQTSCILGSVDPASELHIGGTCRAPLSESTTALVNDETANFESLKYSNEEDMIPSSLFSSSRPLQSSGAGSIMAGEGTLHQPISPKRSPTDPMLQIHESAINAEPPPPVSLVYDPAISEKNDALETHSDHAVGSGSMQASEEACITQPLSGAENTQIFVKGIYPVQCNKEDTPDIVLPTNTAIGSLAGSSAEVLHENFSSQTVSSQSFSTEDGIAKPVFSSVVNLPDNSGDVPKHWPSAVSFVADTVTTVSAASFSPPSVQALKETSTQSSVKAKIKAFESNLSQDLDHHGSCPLKSQDRKIQAERAVQRLRAEVAAAEAAEARRRAEEEEARLKSISEEEAKKRNLQQRLEGSRFRHASKSKGKFLQKNDGQTQREMQEAIKEFNVTEEYLRTQKARRRKEKIIQETEDKRLDVRDREKKHALVESADSVYSSLIHDRKLPKPDGNEKLADAIALKRQSRIDASAEASGTGKTFEGKQHLEVQKARMSVAESRQISADENKSEEISTSKQTKEFASTMERNRARQFAECVASSGADSANDKEKQRQGSEHDIAFDQRVQPMISRTSFVEDIPHEGGSIISDEDELEDLLRSSNALGGFIKQALGAAAVLAAGALFMWMRGERMNKRRANTTQPKERHYFQQKGEKSTRVLPRQSEEPNLGISKPNSKDLLYPGRHLSLL